MIVGYKCFNEGLVNRYGKKFELGMKYRVYDEIRFRENGFHLCTNLEDTLRYFDAMNEKVEIAKVLGFGNIDIYNDEYNGFYDMYAVEYMEIMHVLTRDEIINYAIHLPVERLRRFISLYRLTKDEIIAFKQKYSNIPAILMTIEYYQENNIKVFEKKRIY